MPYIKNEKRQKITPVIHGENGRVEMRHIDSAGDLNYAFTMIVIDYIKRKGMNYQNINDVVGSLEGAKAEFQRRIVNAYEETKIKENGDIYITSTTKYPSVAEFNGN